MTFYSIHNWYEEFDDFSLKHLKISKISTLMDCFDMTTLIWSKYIMFEKKRYRGVMLASTADWCKMWRKTDLYFLKWHEKLVNFQQSTFESLKIGNFLGSFIQNGKCVSLKFRRKFVICRENEEWCKIWRWIDLSIQNWHE